MSPDQLSAIQNSGANVTPEMMEAFLSLTKLQQDIAIGHISGLTHLESYNQSKGAAKTDKAKISSAGEILSNLDVIAFLNHAKGERLNSAIMGRDEAMEKLTVLARGNLSDIVEFSTVETEGEEGEKIRQAVWSIPDIDNLPKDKLAIINELTAGKEGLKIKVHDSKAAIKQLSDMQGWNSATKHELTGAEGKPIQTISATIDPIAAGKAYEDMIKS